MKLSFHLNCHSIYIIQLKIKIYIFIIRKSNISIWLSTYIEYIIVYLLFFFAFIKENLSMTRRRKLMQQYSKQLSSIPNRQKPFSRKQRRRIRQRLRRQQCRIKMGTRSMSMTTQIAADAFDMLHISTESNTNPLEFIERYELTRQHALQMPLNQRPILFLMEYKNSRVFSNAKSELHNSIDEDYSTSFV